MGDTVRLLKGDHEGAVGVVLEKTGGGWMKILTPLGTVKVQGRASVDKVDQVAAGKENAGTPPPPPAAVTPPTPPVVSSPMPPVVMPPTPPVVSSPAPPAAPQAATSPQTARPQPTPPTWTRSWLSA